MPGTIHVSVLEFKDPGSSSVSLKVAMGKKVHQTWDKGDFAFPLTKLRDNLAFTLQDAEGNDISHTSIQTLSVVEKGCWEDVFHFEGGGYMIMKLQFILSEEDRSRIRTVRESAVKKKEESMPYTNTRYSKTSSSLVGSAPSSFLTNLEVLDRSEATSSSFIKQEVEVQSPEVHETALAVERKTLVPQAKVPIESVTQQDALSKVGLSETDVSAETQSISLSAESQSVTLKLEHELTSTAAGPDKLEKTPSSVRKMISAFESSLAQTVPMTSKQDKRPLTSVRASKSQPNIVGMGGSVDDLDPKEVIASSKTIPGRSRNPPFTGKTQQIQTKLSRGGVIAESCKDFIDFRPSQTSDKQWELSATMNQLKAKDSGIKNILKRADEESIAKELTMLPIDVRLCTSKEATVSGRIIMEHSVVPLPLDASALQQDSGGTSEETQSGKEIGVQGLSDSPIQESNDKQKPINYCEDDLRDFESSGTWIFPDNRRSLCMTTAGERVMNFLGSLRIVPNTHQRKQAFTKDKDNAVKHSSRETALKVRKDDKRSHKMRKSKPESPAGNSSNGPFQQAIKIAVVVGFGILVLLAREKEPRKKDPKPDDSFFTIPDYIDQLSSEL